MDDEDGRLMVRVGRLLGRGVGLSVRLGRVLVGRMLGVLVWVFGLTAGPRFGV